jgi:hypothetical protein
LKTNVLVQGARGKVSYVARSGCHYWTITQLQQVSDKVNFDVGTLGRRRQELSLKAQVDIDRRNAILPGDVESLRDIQSAQQTQLEIERVDRQLEIYQRLATILGKVEQHGDTQVVVPYWTPSQGGVSIVHKCSVDFPKELRDHLLKVVQTKGPIWSQFFWRSLDVAPCPQHVNKPAECKEVTEVWEGLKPKPMPVFLQNIVKEKVTKTTNPADWDAFHRGLFAWWQCILSWNISHPKRAESVEYPGVLGGRSVAEQKTRLTGDQRTAKQIDAAVARAMAPVTQALEKLVVSSREAQAGVGTATLADGSLINLVSTAALEEQINHLYNSYMQVAKTSLANTDPLMGGQSSSTETAGVSPDTVPSRAEDSSENREEDLELPEIGQHTYNGLSWYVCTSWHEIDHVIMPNSVHDSLAELVMCVRPGHPAFPSSYLDSGIPSLWLVSMSRAHVPLACSPPLKVIPTGVSQAETVLDLTWTSLGSKEDKKEGKKKSEGSSGAASSSDKASSKKSEKKKSDKDSGASAGEGSSSTKKGNALNEENPLKVQNKPKSAGLTDEQKETLKRALGLPTDPIDQDVLANMSKEDRRAALADRTLPRWAVTAVLNNPSNLERIVKKELTKDNFGKKAADKGTSAQQEWMDLKSKFPGVTLLRQPHSNKEKDLKKAWDALVRKWGRDAPGIPKPKGKRDTSVDSTGGVRGRSRQRAGAGSNQISGLNETMKLLGELARAFSGK